MKMKAILAGIIIFILVAAFAAPGYCDNPMKSFQPFFMHHPMRLFCPVFTMD